MSKTICASENNNILNNLNLNMVKLNKLLAEQTISIEKISDFNVNNNKSLSNLTGLENLSIKKIFKKISKYGINGNLTRKEFNSFFKELIKKNKIKCNLLEKERVENFINNIFLKLQKNKLINYKPLICGLALLTRDDIQYKTEFIFNLYYSLHSKNIQLTDINIFLDGCFTIWSLIQPSNIKSPKMEQMIINILNFYCKKEDSITWSNFRILIYSLNLILVNFKIY